jgi:hypothetical protein
MRIPTKSLALPRGLEPLFFAVRRLALHGIAGLEIATQIATQPFGTR